MMKKCVVCGAMEPLLLPTDREGERCCVNCGAPYDEDFNIVTLKPQILTMAKKYWNEKHTFVFYGETSRSDELETFREFIVWALNQEGSTIRQFYESEGKGKELDKLLRDLEEEKQKLEQEAENLETQGVKKNKKRNKRRKRADLEEEELEEKNLEEKNLEEGKKLEKEELEKEELEKEELGEEDQDSR